MILIHISFDSLYEILQRLYQNKQIFNKMYKRWQNLVPIIILSVIMEMRKDYPCILCGRQVRPRQQALECDLCHQWHHHTCNTGISKADYRAAVKNKADIPWKCLACSLACSHCICIVLFCGLNTVPCTMCFYFVTDW